MGTLAFMLVLLSIIIVVIDVQSKAPRIETNGYTVGYFLIHFYPYLMLYYIITFFSILVFHYSNCFTCFSISMDDSFRNTIVQIFIYLDIAWICSC